MNLNKTQLAQRLADGVLDLIDTGRIAPESMDQAACILRDAVYELTPANLSAGALEVFHEVGDMAAAILRRAERTKRPPASGPAPSILSIVRALARFAAAEHAAELERGGNGARSDLREVLVGPAKPDVDRRPSPRVPRAS